VIQNQQKNPDRHQNPIIPRWAQHHKNSSKSVQKFLIDPADEQTDKETNKQRAKT